MRGRVRGMRWGATVVLGVVTMLIAGCGDGEEGAVDTSLTREAAQERMYGYLDDALAALPPGTSLTRRHPELSTSFGPTTTTPCDDDNTVEDGPLFLTAAYWVAGVPPGRAGDYYDTLVRSWTERGWSTTDRSRSDTRGVNGESPDGYRLTADVNARGDLAVGAVSPCFARGDGGPGTVDTPDVVERP